MTPSLVTLISNPNSSQAEHIQPGLVSLFYFQNSNQTSVSSFPCILRCHIFCYGERAKPIVNIDKVFFYVTHLARYSTRGIKHIQYRHTGSVLFISENKKESFIILSFEFVVNYMHFSDWLNCIFFKKSPSFPSVFHQKSYSYKTCGKLKFLNGFYHTRVVTIFTSHIYLVVLQYCFI